MILTFLRGATIPLQGAKFYSYNNNGTKIKIICWLWNSSQKVYEKFSKPNSIWIDNAIDQKLVPKARSNSPTPQSLHLPHYAAKQSAVAVHFRAY